MGQFNISLISVLTIKSFDDHSRTYYIQAFSTRQQAKPWKPNQGQVKLFLRPSPFGKKSTRSGSIVGFTSSYPAKSFDSSDSCSSGRGDSNKYYLTGWGSIEPSSPSSWSPRKRPSGVGWPSEDSAAWRPRTSRLIAEAVELLFNHDVVSVVIVVPARSPPSFRLRLRTSPYHRHRGPGPRAASSAASGGGPQALRVQVQLQAALSGPEGWDGAFLRVLRQ